VLKILHVAQSYLPYIGGSSLRLKNLIQPLAEKKKCEMHVLVPKHGINGKKIYQHDNLKDCEIIEGVHVYRVNYCREIPSYIRQINRKYRFDIIHAHNARFAYYAWRSKLLLPFVIEIHAVTSMSWMKRVVYRKLLQRADRIIVLSDGAFHYVCKEWHLPPEKVAVVVNGVDSALFTSSVSGGKEIREKLSLNAVPVAGYVGTFYDWQGVSNFVSSIPYIINKCPAARFLLVGDGPDWRNVCSLVQSLGLSKKVILTGKVQPCEVPKYIAAMDVFVIARPSTLATETAIPLKLLEAMSAGKALVATDVAGLTEVVDDGKNGLIVPQKAPVFLGESIADLLNDKRKALLMGRMAQKKVSKKYSWDSASTKLMDVYNGAK